MQRARLLVVLSISLSVSVVFAWVLIGMMRGAPMLESPAVVSRKDVSGGPATTAAMDKDEVEFVVGIISHEKQYRHVRVAADTWLMDASGGSVVQWMCFGDVAMDGCEALENHDPALLGQTWNGNNPSDARVVSGVGLLNATFSGRFRWMLVADDDTMFFLSRLHTRLARLDHRQPWAEPPTRHCAPYTESRVENGTTLHRKPTVVVDRACCRSWPEDVPCLVADSVLSASSASSCPVLEAAEGDSFVLSRHPDAVDKYGFPPKASPYGGAGYILSAGLLDSIPTEHWKECAKRVVCGGGDVRLAMCIQAAGVGVGLTHWSELSRNKWEGVRRELPEKIVSVHRAIGRQVRMMWLFEQQEALVSNNSSTREHMRRRIEKKNKPPSLITKS